MFLAWTYRETVAQSWLWQEYRSLTWCLSDELNYGNGCQKRGTQARYHSWRQLLKLESAYWVVSTDNKSYVLRDTVKTSKHYSVLYVLLPAIKFGSFFFPIRTRYFKLFSSHLTQAIADRAVSAQSPFSRCLSFTRWSIGVIASEADQKSPRTTLTFGGVHNKSSLLLRSLRPVIRTAWSTFSSPPLSKLRSSWLQQIYRKKERNCVNQISTIQTRRPSLWKSPIGVIYISCVRSREDQLTAHTTEN